MSPKLSSPKCSSSKCYSPKRFSPKCHSPKRSSRISWIYIKISITLKQTKINTLGLSSHTIKIINKNGDDLIYIYIYFNITKEEALLKINNYRLHIFLPLSSLKEHHSSRSHVAYHYKQSFCYRFSVFLDGSRISKSRRERDR